jgi:hypothetical protein
MSLDRNSSKSGPGCRVLTGSDALASLGGEHGQEMRNDSTRIVPANRTRLGYLRRAKLVHRNVKDVKPITRSVLLKAVIGVVAVAMLWILAPLTVLEMTSETMEPLIRGRGRPPSREGDYVLVCTWLRLSVPKEGALVLVEIPTATGAVETIRRIKRIDSGEKMHFIVESLDPRGIDSRHFGALEAEKVKGKVVYVCRS